MTRPPRTAPDRIYRRARLLLILAAATIGSGFSTYLFGYRPGILLLLVAWALITFLAGHIGWLRGYRAARTGQAPTV